jgi:hypothetical protein
MKFMVFEGTTEEFNQIAPSMGLGKGSEVEALNAVSEVVTADGSEVVYLTSDQVKAVLTRRPLDWAMKLMLRRLYEAGDKRVKSEELREELGFSAPQFRGMMGAFGRRKANTEGIPTNGRLFDEEWDFEAHQKTWSLPPSTRLALEDLNLDEE